MKSSPLICIINTIDATSMRAQKGDRQGSTVSITLAESNNDGREGEKKIILNVERNPSSSRGAWKFKK